MQLLLLLLLLLLILCSWLRLMPLESPEESLTWRLVFALCSLLLLSSLLLLLRLGMRAAPLVPFTEDFASA